MAGHDPILKVHLEYPDFLPRHRLFHVQGWVVARTPVRRIAVEGPEGAPLELRTRPDVLRTFPEFPHSTGFFGIARPEQLSGTMLSLRVEVEGGGTTATFTLEPESLEVLDRRRAKLERVYPVLRCVACGAGLAAGGFSPESDEVRCPECGAAYDCSTGCFDLLPAEQRSALEPTNADNISANHYDASALEFIHRCREGLVLDCGAGLRTTEYPHVVNLEVVPYRSTDVLGLNERLPFLDGSFDGVLSLAVLEHVKNPFESARELVRVLRPGGVLLAVVPLLAPVHAYPHHYYNMTSEGLVNLFAGQLDVLETKVPESGRPIWALTWMLRSWADGLDGDARRSFLELRVGDLLGEGGEYLHRDFVASLPSEKDFELAGTTLLYGRKPG